MTRERLFAVLTATWWIVFPSFTALTARLAVERACADPYDLLRDLTSNPAWGWLLASVYVAAHVWIIAAYLITAADGDDLLPGPHVFGAVWRTSVAKLVAVAIVFAVEYAPVTLWRLLGHAVHCRP